MYFETSDASSCTQPYTSRTILVDSRHRDPSVYPHAHTYRVHVPVTLRNVTAARLVSAELPNTDPTFSSVLGNVSLTITAVHVTKTITIPDGQYSVDSMALAVQTKLNDAYAAVSISFEVSVDPASRKLTIAMPSYPDADLSLADQPVPDSLAWSLGFRTVRAGLGSIVSEDAVSVHPEQYRFVHIRNLGRTVECATQGTVFAKIPRKEDGMYVVTYYDRLITKNRLNPAIATLRWLDISITTREGTPIEGLADHALTLEFWCSETHDEDVTVP